MTEKFNIINEPIKSYQAGSKERISLQKKYDELSANKIEIPIIINGERIKTGDIGKCVMPHDHQKVLATYHKASDKVVRQTIESSLNAWTEWSKTDLEYRTNIFRKAGSLLAGKWRDTINAATMLNQSKNAFQAEIDSACELIDFFNFNANYAENIHNKQNLISPNGMKNSLEYRPLEGFIFAITPFNFTSIAGNLPTAPVVMGNVSIWKPASSAVLACYYLMEMLQEAGLPDGVINFLPGSGSSIGDPILNHPSLAGVHFTGSTNTFNHIWKTIGTNISQYKTYPRIVGETGGKDYCLAHKSCDIDVLVTAMVRGAFEYQGQKCSAMSRAYIPSTIWSEVKDKFILEVETIKIGSPRDFSNFMNAVIDKSAFDTISSYIDYAKDHKDAEIISGGRYDDSKGYFIEPTTILTTDPYFKTMTEEIFGPVLTIYLYDPEKWNETIQLVESTSDYGLTGCIIANDNEKIIQATKELVHSAGNFYINDKPTGAVVGQQPFGGSRASGTNDKAGSELNLLRWVSVRTIKENFEPPKDYRYPFLEKE
ncbi:MAG: L-glutamate gamma-semialdehyde dehydrogenase [Candidatus Neomarinimicrobiota bacterium]|nr:L-glutamate gamma-semialdehyde dehydrogenase [Candidatus Neomarinimicrobiota bacterium]